MKVDWKIGFFIQFSYFDFIDVKIKETLVIRIRPGFCPKFIHFFPSDHEWTTDFPVCQTISQVNICRYQLNNIDLNIE